ncbi:GntR family transcriptional regulator [Streptomyces rubiginosohelvolus]|uniref:GntR family transcriptional regulator n=1 Tax=Streptomyces rubiginosohelvolus TaxID=67362 RepID=A0ABW6F639_9ACTN
MNSGTETSNGNGSGSGAPVEREPKHEALRTALTALIDDGLAPHEALPSERELMQRYSVSRMTVRRAVERLTQEGRVYRVQGAGTFVADPATISKSLHLTSFSEDIRSRRMVPDSRLLLLERTEADLDCARDLFLAPGSPVVHLERLRTADGEPMCLENVWLPETLVPGLVDQGEPHSLYGWLERAGAAPETADQTIRATVVGPREAGLLEVPPQFPALLVERVTRDIRGRAVERAISLYRADRYDYRLTISRERRR